MKELFPQVLSHLMMKVMQASVTISLFAIPAYSYAKYESYSQCLTGCAKRLRMAKYDLKKVKGIISIKAKNGKVVNLEDRITNDDGYRQYEFDRIYGSRDKGYYGFVLLAHESSGYVFINVKNGNVTEVANKPKFSIGYKWFVAWNDDLETQYSVSILSIYKFGRNSIKKVWSERFSREGPSRPLWINDNLLVFILRQEKNSKIQGVPVFMKFDGKKWSDPKEFEIK
jgi:hypothetical protein